MGTFAADGSGTKAVFAQVDSRLRWLCIKVKGAVLAVVGLSKIWSAIFYVY